jgi:alkylated DNA repair dioxygenase AlkB
MVNGVTFIEDFFPDSQALFEHYRFSIPWNENMISRKTACYGEPYDYSEQMYDFQPLLPEMVQISKEIQLKFGFEPNNCLLNYYENGQAKIGYHADTTTMLVPNTGIAVLSLGGTRTFRFRKIDEKDLKINYLLKEGSLIYMTYEMQSILQHGIMPENTEEGRISLTFRKMIPGLKKMD